MGCTTLNAGFAQTVARLPEENFLGTRNKDLPGMPYEWKTFKQIDTLAENFAKGKF
jgi:hypothetical protein